jgi:hypothetical protein
LTTRYSSNSTDGDRAFTFSGIRLSETARSWLTHLALVLDLPWLFIIVDRSHVGDTRVRWHGNGFRAIFSRMPWADFLRIFACTAS